MTLKLKLVTSVETTNILRDACRSKLEINQLVLKKARRICWTWARSSHFMWANSSSRLYWPSWSRAWTGPVVIALSDAQSGRLYWPNIGPILGLKVRFLLCPWFPFCVARYREKQQKRCFFWFTSLHIRIWNFNRMCVVIFLSLSFNLVLLNKLDKK